MTSKMFNLLTLKFKYAPHLGLLSAGIFSKLYYNNSKKIVSLSSENISNYPSDINTEFVTVDSSNIFQVLNALTTYSYDSINIKIPSNLFENNKHLFRTIKIFKNECLSEQHGLSTSDIFEYCNVYEKSYNSLHDIPVCTDCFLGETDGNGNQIIMGQQMLLPEITMCNFPSCRDRDGDGDGDRDGDACKNKETNIIFHYENPKIYSKSPVVKLNNVNEIKDLITDAGYPQVAKQMDFLNSTLNTDAQMVAYTQNFDTDTVYMNVAHSVDKNMRIIFNVQIITDDKTTLIEKSIEKHDNRTMYGTMIMFSLCVIIRNLIPF